MHGLCALRALHALHTFSHRKSLVNKCSLSQPLVELEQKFKKFLKVCIKDDIIIVYERLAVRLLKNSFFLVVMVLEIRKFE